MGSPARKEPSPTVVRATEAEGDDQDERPPYRQGPVRDPAIPTLYTILLLVVLLEFPRLGVDRTTTWGVAFILGAFLARELSVFYTIDRKYLNAWRLFGWRRVPLTSIRKVEEVSLRDLSPTGFFGAWGWRSRLWSPLVGKFDAVYTFHRGVLVTTDRVALFLSPAHREAFVEELARRTGEAGSAVEWAGGALDRS